GCLGGGCRGGLGGHGVILPDRESLIVTNRLASLVASGEPPESARIRRVRAPRSARTAPARPRRTAAPNGTGRNRCARRGTTRCRAGPSAPTTAPPARAGAPPGRRSRRRRTGHAAAPAVAATAV